jgi:N-acetylglucosaminyldiphosphoundecaprenol N-acetyl-beta-D-mannosaminyltransferase
MRRTSLSIPDGMPIVWGSRLIGTPLRTRVAGADLVAAIVERAEQQQTRVALFGAGPSVAQRAAERLLERYPKAFVMADSGPMFRSIDELRSGDLGALLDFDPDICCVAFGNPKQEFFIERFGRDLAIPVMIGVGGSLDFIVGEQRRAPRWMQRSGLEWVHRAATERHRLPRRYLHDAGVFFPRLAVQIWRGRRSGSGSVRCALGADGEMLIDLTALGAVDNRAASQIAGAIRSAWVDARQIVVRRGASTRLTTVPGLAEMVDAASLAS